MDRAYVSTGGVLLLVAAGVVWTGSSYEYLTEVGPGPGFFPVWLGILLGVLAITFLVEAIRSRSVQGSILPGGPALRRVLMVFGALLGMVVLMWYVGFVPSATVFTFFMLTAFGKWRWWTNLVVAMVTSFGMWTLLVSWLSVSLPRGFFN